MSAEAADLLAIAKAVDPAVTGVAIDPSPASTGSFVVVVRPDGVRVLLVTSSGGAPTPAAVAAVADADTSDAAVAARAVAAVRAVALSAFALAREDATRDRALALVTVDEINLLRQWLTAFKAAVAASTSLANLQTRVAALANLPDRTAAQAKAAVGEKIDAGAAD